MSSKALKTQGKTKVFASGLGLLALAGCEDKVRFELPSFTDAYFFTN